MESRQQGREWPKSNHADATAQPHLLSNGKRKSIAYAGLDPDDARSVCAHWHAGAGAKWHQELDLFTSIFGVYYLYHVKILETFACQLLTLFNCYLTALQVRSVKILLRMKNDRFRLNARICAIGEDLAQQSWGIT